MSSFPIGAFRTQLLFSAAILSLATAIYGQAPAHADASSQLPETYRVGLKSISIPPPSKDLPEIGSDYRVVLETLAPATNRLVAAFNRPEDLHQILAGGNAPLPRYALVEIPRRAEFVDVDSASFRTVIDNVAQSFGANLDADVKKAQDDLNRKIKDLDSNSSAIALEKPLALGAFFSKPEAAAFGLVESVAAQGPATKMALGVVVLRVQNRVVFLYLYSVYKDESSIQWVRSTGEQWADAVLAANKQ
jgi:hypothetical protein